MEHKLEDPKRTGELNPPETLKRIGLKKDGAFCDIGAGTGIFTFAAAEQTQSDIYAVEISDAFFQILQAKRLESKADKVQLLKDVRDVPSNSCGTVLLCTVLHELEDIQAMMREIKRILRPEGVLAVIEFHKRQTPLGPPEVRRISPGQVEEILKQCGLCQKEYFELGENFYVQLAK